MITLKYYSILEEINRIILITVIRFKLIKKLYLFFFIDFGGESMATISPLAPKATEETGFLKIANVVSLAQSEGNFNASIRKALESPQQSKGQLSILKKPNYIIKRLDGAVSNNETLRLVPIQPNNVLNRPENIISIAGQQAVTIKIDAKTMSLPLSVTTTPSTMSTLSSSTTHQPLRIVKLTPQNDMPLAIKLKSKEVYQKMLVEDKLVHVFKCMGGECSFSTSNELAFNKHIRTHESDVASANETVKDYLKCAYCFIDNTSYESLMIHLKNMHIFCRYCCKYCFYRAFASSYVEIHQVNFLF